MLPQRRKSAEEIAKLREAMGLPGAEPAAEEVPEPTPEPERPVEVVTAKMDREISPEPVRAERPAPVEQEAPRKAKRVMSLKKGEKGLVDVEAIAQRAAADHGLPYKKHTDRELVEMRRETLVTPVKSITYVNSLAAPTFHVVVMYVLLVLATFIGWSSLAWNPVPAMDFPAEWIANIFNNPGTPDAGKWILIGLCAIALLMAGWIAWKRPRSRHHSGFVTILAVLVLSFGIIYHLPQPHGP